VKASIQDVISLGWVWIWKGNNGRMLKGFQVWNKPNLDNIVKSCLSYYDLEPNSMI
jgi:hypothetical protein